MEEGAAVLFGTFLLVFVVFSAIHLGLEKTSIQGNDWKCTAHYDEGCSQWTREVSHD